MTEILKQIVSSLVGLVVALQASVVSLPNNLNTAAVGEVAGDSVAIKAFPSAEGFGQNTVGGRGGKIIEVTNLNDTGTGSLRACAEAAGPRTCVFRVGGTIALNSDIRIQAANSYLTIAGQTAPGDGVQLKNHHVSVSYGAHDVIIRFIKVREGADQAPENINDCAGIAIYGPGNTPVSNVIVDHSSFEWTCEDAVNVYATVTDITIQWSLIGEGLDEADYPRADNKAMIAGENGSTKLTMHHNLFATMGSRLPLIKGVNVVDFRNNLIYDWVYCTAGSMGLTGEVTRVNFVGNNYISGPDTNLGCAQNHGIISVGGDTKIYLEDNRAPRCPNSCPTNEWDIGIPYHNLSLAPEATFRSYTPFSAPSVITTTSGNLESVLVPNVGATKPVRDSMDSRIINYVSTRTGHAGRRTETLPVLNSGTPPVDSDHDGMPDSWENSHGLNSSNASDGSAVSSSGYTFVENYLNELAGDTVPAFNNLNSSASASTPASASIPTYSQYLIAHLSLDETSGAVASDSSGNNYPGTLLNGPVWTTGKMGNALSFDGANDSVDLGDINNLDSLSALTVSYWVKFNDLSNSNQHIVSKRPANGTTGWGTQTGSDSLLFLLGGNNTLSVVSTNNGTISAGNWYHVTMTFDGSQSTEAGRAKIYLNGQQAATTRASWSAPVPASLSANSEHVWFGYPTDPYDSYLKGVLDDVRIYNYVLSQSEIQILYSNISSTQTSAVVSAQTSTTASSQTSASVSSQTSSSGSSSSDSSYTSITTSNPSSSSSVSGSAMSYTPAAASISKNIALGARGFDVTTLQNFLVRQGYLTADNATGYFGYLTQTAVQKFQKANNIVSSGGPNSTGYGAVGPATRAKINTFLGSSSSASVQSLQEQIKILQAMVNELILKLQKMQKN